MIHKCVCVCVCVRVRTSGGPFWRFQRTFPRKPLLFPKECVAQSEKTQMLLVELLVEVLILQAVGVCMTELRITLFKRFLHWNCLRLALPQLPDSFSGCRCGYLRILLQVFSCQILRGPELLQFQAQALSCHPLPFLPRRGLRFLRSVSTVWVDTLLYSKSIHSASLLQTEPSSNHSYFCSNHSPSEEWLFHFP